MTTVAFRDGILAADSAASRGDIITGSVTKVRKLDGGVRVAVIGNYAAGLTLIQQFVDGVRRPDMAADQAQVVFVHPTGLVEVFDGSWEPAPDAAFHAWGSGSEIALGAMHAGASAEQAVQAAIAFDAFSAGPIAVLRGT